MLRVKFSPLAAMAVAAAIAVSVPGVSNAAVYSNGTNTTTFDVTLKIIANCVISALPLDFGQTQGVLATAVNVNTTLNVTCTNTTLYNVGLNAGTGAGSVGTTRYLSGTGGNTATVQFNLFQAAGATVWGNTQGTDTHGGTGNGTAQPITVYGNVPPQSTPMPDTYKSTITATVYF
ncbi:spore coat U domain-containing protein [Janthinobacterium sp. P210006]|nr:MULTISPECIES: spore coat U domain-containing protein [Janthinobacterium]MED5597466.1 spore coat U domain-containing protein [Janthinobacterium sp. P210006]